MTQNHPWLLIVNPNAGKGLSTEIFAEIEESLRINNVEYFTVYTDKKGHAAEITFEKLMQGYTKIIVAGGDGTINEVVNGIFSQNAVPVKDILIAVMPFGTGNDWVRTHNISKHFLHAASLINEGKIVVQDVGIATYFENNVEKKRYFVNNIGAGFDAYVVEQTNKKKENGKHGSGLYLLSLLRYLLEYKSKDCRITIDETLYKGKVLSICTGIGRYNGGGMMPLPESVIDDGLLDVSVFTKMSKLEVLLNISKLYNGSIYKNKKIRKFQGEKVYIDLKDESSIEADGEILGTGPFTIEIIQKSLKIIAG